MTESTKHAIIEASAEGRPIRTIAADVGVSKSAVGRVVKSERERIEAMQETLQARLLERTLERADEVAEARLSDASNRDSRTGAQSTRAMLEGCGVVGRGASVHIGDLNIGNLTISDERRQIVLSCSPEERKVRMAVLRRELGIADA